MKKITFIMFALIAGTTFAQNTASTSAETFAEIVDPLIISKSADLNFGRIIGGSAGGGNVTIDADGVRDIGAALDAPGGTIQAAQFDITSSNYTYSIGLTATDLSVADGEAGTSMGLTPSSSLGASSSGDQTLIVGGTLAVGANQEAGTYSGTVTVKLDYN